MSSERTASDALEALGLTQYEAECFVALVRVPKATAAEISDISGVPRSRVYDSVDRLNDRGLVDTQESEPRRFRAVSTDEALEKLRREHSATLEAAGRALGRLETKKSPEEKGVWAIASAEHVNDRITTLLDDAEERVHHIVADERVLSETVLDRLAAATDRGVSVVIEVPSESVQERVRRAVPEADVPIFGGLRESEKVVDKWPGQALMVDRHAVLASGVEQHGLPDVTKETAVWTTGRDHGFATWMRELLGDRLERTGRSEER
ncbi:TrmB family transcriptional regulator [Haloprofundus salinisoli]|uniref:TrmB family transcriptional regulator n=1 Tax=Haloprofundus salinisoli TaxID=2876193 RepID=UPI001CCB1AA4|nr:helix-turn-helix domain-containing protein [Haloprofundus salinisoli]